MTMIKIPNNLYDHINKLDINKIVKLGLDKFFDFDEVQQKEYLFNCMKYQSSVLNITLMMTMKCNFRCKYCFENSINSSYRLRVLDEKLFVLWLINLIKKYNIKKVDLCFHGGEPLLEVE